MKVSIVIPCFNEEKWIEKTAEAALAQNSPNFEVVLVNNASTDNTLTVLNRIKAAHPDKVTIVEEPRPGVLMAREAGRAAATGDIIAQLDADCIPPKDWIARALPHFNDPRIIAVAGSYDYYDAPWLHRYGMLAAQTILMPPVNYIVQKLKRRAAFVGGNIFIRAETLRKAGGYSQVSTFYGDEIDTANRIAPFGDIISTPLLSVKTSARRYQANGFWSTQSKYDKSTLSAIQKNVVHQEEENHPR